MARVTLDFDYCEERHEYMMAVSANALYCCLWDLEQELRNIVKRGELFYKGQKFENMEGLIDLIREDINEEISKVERF